MARRWLDSPVPYFALAAVLLAGAIASQFELRIPSRHEQPVEKLLELRKRGDLNVVFLLIDTLRADRLGVYGYPRNTSRVIDEAASYGIVFDDVVSQSSWTKTSMASLWTATHPIRNGILRYSHVIPEQAVLPAEIFRDAGYRTVGLWRNGWVEGNFGFAQGFETYVRPAIGRERIRIHRQSRSPNPLAGTDEDLTIAALDFLDRFGAQQRFFLYLHYMDVHQYVYDEDAAIFGTSYSDIYDQAIHWTDRLVGVLLDRLEQMDLLERTIVVIGADHGEAFLEHGREGHAQDLHDEVTHVPLIILPPFLLDPGIRVKTTVSNADLWPTVLELVGLPPLPGADGRSLVPMILAAGGAQADPAALEPRPAFAQLVRGWGRPRLEHPGSLVSVTDRGMRLFTVLSSDAPPELYDRTADPHERKDLAAAEPAALERLRGLVKSYEAHAAPPWGSAAPEVELDDMRLNQLRALGYVVERPQPKP